MRYCDQEGSRTQKIWFSQFALIVADARIAISVVYPFGLAIFTEYYCARTLRLPGDRLRGALVERGAARARDGLRHRLAIHRHVHWSRFGAQFIY